MCVQGSDGGTQTLPKNIASLFATGMALRMIVFCLDSAAQYLCNRVLKAGLLMRKALRNCSVLKVCLPLPRPVPQHFSQNP